MNNSHTILVVDDDPGMLNSLGMLLGHAGFQVTTAPSLTDALQLLNQHYYDIVITDYYLQDGHGSEIMKFCKEFCPKTRVIVMTGNASLETAVEAIRNGAFDYVIKPFDFDLLFHSIKRALEHINILEEIALARERYRALIEDLHEGYLVLKEDFRPGFVNAKMAQILNCKINEIIEHEIWDFIDASSQKILREKLEFLDKAPGAFFLEEVIFRDCKGNTVPAEVRITNTIGDYLGKGIIMICREITERDMLWKRLVRSERLATMGEMVAGVAHELNNKLTPILGFGEILAQSHDLPQETYEKCVTGINTAATSAKKIVESLLLFSRQEKPAMLPCDLNKIVRNAVNLAESWISGSDIFLCLDLPDDPVQVKVDAHQIEQVITNIIKNAIEASSGGQGRISISTRLDPVKRQASVTIEDNGPGIPEEFLDKIFEPFFSTKSKQKGTGLGLSICHGIIKEHGGTIAVSSRPGLTRFSITLPVANAVEEHPDEPSSQLQFDFKGKTRPRLLVVDDEFEISELLTEVFSDTFETEQAANGMEALEMIRQKRFDVIISDVKMPKLGGIDFYRELEKEAEGYCSRIIFTTGIASDLKTQQFLKSRGLPFLQKPFKLKELISAVNDILNEAALKETEGSSIREPVDPNNNIH